jgi:hypothetical protein
LEQEKAEAKKRRREGASGVKKWRGLRRGHFSVKQCCCCSAGVEGVDQCSISKSPPWAGYMMGTNGREGTAVIQNVGEVQVKVLNCKALSSKTSLFL